MSKSYTTIQGDMWDGVAKRQYGNEAYLKQLLEANPDYADYVIFPAGIVLTLPDIDTAETVKLPPWKE